MLMNDGATLTVAYGPLIALFRPRGTQVSNHPS